MMMRLGFLLAWFGVKIVKPDCELCTIFESDDTSFKFQIDSVLFDDRIKDELHPYFRMQIESEFSKKNNEQSPLTVNLDGKSSSYIGCFDVPSKEMQKYLSSVNVTFTTRLLNSEIEKKEECFGSGQTNVRLAYWPHSVTLDNDTEINFSFNGPSKVNEVCIGYEGGYCQIKGNGESKRRCHLRPAMADGCDVYLSHSDRTLIATVNHSSNSTIVAANQGRGSILMTSLIGENGDWVNVTTVSGFKDVYIASLIQNTMIVVSDIQNSTMVEVMADEKESNQTVILRDTHLTTLNIRGNGRQKCKVSVIGLTTELNAFISVARWRNRIDINARCAQGLTLNTAIIGGGQGDFVRLFNGRVLRVGCPEQSESMCRIRDWAQSRAKQILIAKKQAWKMKNSNIQVRGNHKKSYQKGYPAFYTSESKWYEENSEECCSINSMCDFERQCKLVAINEEDQRGYFGLSEDCDSFVLSFYVPFVHVVTSVVYLISVASLLIVLIRDEKIQQSTKHVKYLMISLVYSGIFACLMLIGTVFEAWFNEDMFEDMRRRALITGSLGLFILPFQAVFGSDMHWLQFSLIQEIQDSKLDWDSTNSTMIRQNRFDKYAHILCLKVFLVLSILEYPIGFYVITAPVLIASISSKLPNIGLCLCYSWVIWGSLSAENHSISDIMGLLCWNYFDLTFAWALAFECAYGEVTSSLRMLSVAILVRCVKLFRLIAQIFDLVTDWILVVFFFVNERVLLGLLWMSLIIVTAAVSAYSEWNELNEWWQRILLSMGLGRIIEVMDVSVNEKTRSFLNEAELHLESLPSLIFGMLVVLTAPTEDTGPVLFSMSVTWLTVGLKAIGTVLTLEIPVIWKLLIFVTLVTDFFVRCVSPALITAIIQGQNGEDWTAGSIVFVLLYFVTVLSAYLVYYWNFYSGAVSRSPFYLRAMISTISVRCALFAYLRMDHYKHDAVIATPIDLAVLTIPHCLISLVFSSIGSALLWDVFPDLSIATVISSLIQMGCVYLMSVLPRDQVIPSDIASDLETKGRRSTAIETRMTDDQVFSQSMVEKGEPDTFHE